MNTDASSAPDDPFSDPAAPPKKQTRVPLGQSDRPGHVISPENQAKIAELLKQRNEIPKTSPTYKNDRTALAREIFRLTREGAPQHPKWELHLGRPRFLVGPVIKVMRLQQDQHEFCQKLGQGNISLGVRICIDMAMSARKLPDLPAELDTSRGG